jgi:hypothetical protein
MKSSWRRKFSEDGTTRRIVELKEDNQLTLRWFGGKKKWILHDDPLEILISSSK